MPEGPRQEEVAAWLWSPVSENQLNKTFISGSHAALCGPQESLKATTTSCTALSLLPSGRCLPSPGTWAPHLEVTLDSALAPTATPWPGPQHLSPAAGSPPAGPPHLPSCLRLALLHKSASGLSQSLHTLNATQVPSVRISHHTCLPAPHSFTTQLLPCLEHSPQALAQSRFSA